MQCNEVEYNSGAFWCNGNGCPRWLLWCPTPPSAHTAHTQLVLNNGLPCSTLVNVKKHKKYSGLETGAYMNYIRPQVQHKDAFLLGSWTIGDAKGDKHGKHGKHFCNWLIFIYFVIICWAKKVCAIFPATLWTKVCYDPTLKFKIVLFLYCFQCRLFSLNTEHWTLDNTTHSEPATKNGLDLQKIRIKRGKIRSTCTMHTINVITIIITGLGYHDVVG